jgi:hypothetical protein
MNELSTDHMFPFELVQRSESARKALQSSRVRIWEQQAWGYWMPNGLGYTKNPSKAEVYEFARACQMAHESGHANELLFDPVNDPALEPHDSFKARWKELLNEFRNGPG